MDLELLRRRARIIRDVRCFFDRRDYLEVDTPLLAPDLIPESCLEVFETTRLSPVLASASPGDIPGAEPRTRKSRPYWLIPSPELRMKRLIGDHGVNLYQIGKCFRNGESSGRFHSPEFTMLEYYTMGADYLDSLAITEELFAALQSGNPGGTRSFDGALSPGENFPELKPPFLRITMEEAFARWAGVDLFAAAERRELDAEARRLGLDPPPGMDPPALYDLIFIHAVEPALPRDRPVAILDYPAFVPCLARTSSGGKTRERWELYVRGIELANCYSEETDPEAIRRFFESEGEIKNRSALTPHRIDGDYWKVFLPRKTRDGGERPFPPCSGVALGLDRLIMALTGRSSIDGVLPFPMDPL
ncbi:MAG: LysR family transcriptional regulator [Spirochaetaceae bacterium]|jgi:lysyl-tRNA synthetase class 2|nr:LysR family transcriptional regulator [Spirochaetaceae bacterium]